MEQLSEVSQTALITLRARAIEAAGSEPVLKGCFDQELLEKLLSFLPAEVGQRCMAWKLPLSLTRYIALRARQYDYYVKQFRQENPAALVVSLGCGFDTRYWRVSDQAWPYIEIDLPNVITVKKNIFKDKAGYSMIGCSVLDKSWIKEIQAVQKENVLFLAEGLFMYLPQKEVADLIQAICRSFSKSALVLEVVHKKYTRGFRKKIVEAKMKRNFGSQAGSAYQFGVDQAREIESYAQNIHVEQEWSYFEDPDVKPAFLRLFRHIKLMSRAQWTIKAGIK